MEQHAAANLDTLPVFGACERGATGREQGARLKERKADSLEFSPLWPEVNARVGSRLMLTLH